MTMKLIVHWGPDETADLQVPKEVIWEDGTMATLDDYYKNQNATQSSEQTDKGFVTVLMPDLVAVTRFDTSKGHWVLESPTGDPLDLLEPDPNASDEALKQEIESFPVIYKTTFDRSHLLKSTAAMT
jgi:hypothetical protein